MKESFVDYDSLGNCIILHKTGPNVVQYPQ